MVSANLKLKQISNEVKKCKASTTESKSNQLNQWLLNEEQSVTLEERLAQITTRVQALDEDYQRKLKQHQQQVALPLPKVDTSKVKTAKKELKQPLLLADIELQPIDLATASVEKTVALGDKLQQESKEAMARIIMKLTDTEKIAVQAKVDIMQ